MIAMPFTSPNLSQLPQHHSTADAGRQRAPASNQPADAPATVAAQFRPLDPGILDDSIPAFFIGRNKEGFWVARDVDGRIGGIFLLESSARSFARQNSLPEGCAAIYPSERIELDLENKGNPLVAQLTSLIRFAKRLGRQAAGIFGG